MISRPSSRDSQNNALNMSQLILTAHTGIHDARFHDHHCNVKPEWRQRIAAVVHVDGSARPQIIEREANPLYYDILDAFERESGLPVLVNTSFNVHEEPIVNKPSECIRALLDGRIDFVVTTQGIYERVSPVAG